MCAIAVKFFYFRFAKKGPYPEFCRWLTRMYPKFIESRRWSSLRSDIHYEMDIQTHWFISLHIYMFCLGDRVETSVCEPSSLKFLLTLLVRGMLLHKWNCPAFEPCDSYSTAFEPRDSYSRAGKQTPLNFFFLFSLSISTQSQHPLYSTWFPPPNTFSMKNQRSVLIRTRVVGLRLWTTDPYGSLLVYRTCNHFNRVKSPSCSEQSTKLFLP